MARRLTGDPGVGAGELAAKDDMVGLRRVELAAGLVPLTDEPLGALIQVLEVGGELGISVSIEKRKWSDADLKCSISRKREASYPRRGRSGRGALVGVLVDGHLLEGRRLGFLEELKEEEG